MQFTSELVEDVRTAVDIVALISEHVDLRRSGSRYVGLCPFHSERTPSFSVDPEKQLFHCFGCQAGGDVFSFVMRQTGAPFPQVVEELAHRAGIDTSRFVASPAERQRQQRRRQLLDVNREVAAFYVQVLRSAAGRGARAYLERRGIRLDTVERFGVGYAPPGDAFLSFLAKADIGEDTAVEAGLLSPGRDGRRPYPRFRERIMFPIWDRGGRVIGFGGRLLADHPRAPKYLNSPETPLFSKRRVVYGTHLAATAAKERDNIVIVEGYTDCLRLSQHGEHHVVASLGTAFTEHQAGLLAGLAGSASVAFDADTAGEAATLRSLDVLARAGLRVRVVQLPEDTDPDDYVAEHGIAAWREKTSTALPLLEYKLNKALTGMSMHNVEGRAQAVEAALEVLREIESPVALEGYIGFVAERTGVAVETIKAEMDRKSERAPFKAAPQHSSGKIRHNNKGFRVPSIEQTDRGDRSGGERLAHAEHVILRHVLAGNETVAAFDALEAEGHWSTPNVAEAVALLRSRLPDDGMPEQWLATLPDSGGKQLLRQVWADAAVAKIPWEDGCRALRQHRGRQRLIDFERRLQRWTADTGTTVAAELGRLLIEYKILRSDLLGKQA